MLERDLKEVWAWFDYRRGIIEKLSPNTAHTTLAGWQKRFADFTLVTQNIDGLHHAGGSHDVIELHGNLWRARCVSCCARYELRGLEERERPPSCMECGEAMRPDVVLFGEMLPPGAFEVAAARAQKCELCFVIGTSALVYPAAALPEIARDSGAYVVEVNPERTALSDLCDEAIQGKAGEILPLFDVNREE
jgi:NAD-dependent deacetylase